MADLSFSCVRVARSGHKLVVTYLLALQLSIVLSQSSLLTLKCDPKLGLNCPEPSTRCHRKVGLCECAPDYPIPIYPLRQCVSYRSLGEECVLSEQCKAIANALCLTSDGKEVRETFLRPRKWSKTKGQCRCQLGYRQTQRNRCDLISMDQFVCSGSHQCLTLVSIPGSLNSRSSQWIF